MSISEEQSMASLAEKLLAGTATEAEQEQLHRLYDKWKDDEEQVVSDTARVETLRDEILQAIHARIKERSLPDRNVIPLYRKKWRRYIAAASVIIAASLLYLLYFHPPFKSAPITSARHTPPGRQSPIVPGKDRATLTLADGSVLDLDSSGTGMLAQQGNTRIINKGGKIMYVAQQANSTAIAYNTISTPKGGQYQLVLPDGSRVWLNAKSSIRFPVAFAGTRRMVEISGEAYLEIAKDPARPFIARVKDEEIEVLGTRFNVMAYGEEGKIATTLIEGSVKVNRGKDQHVMRPGQQVVWKENGDFKLNEEADLDEAIAWKDGKFNFINADIQTIMRQIARWYDVDVEYDNISKEVRLGGIISRKEDIRQLLDYFEMTGKVRFIVDGRKITVTSY